MSAFKSPNYTQAPNDLFDELLKRKDFKESELRVTLTVIRHTFGYHRTKFRLSLRKLAKLSGLSASSAYEGAIAAEGRGTMKREQDGGITIWHLCVDESTVSVNDTGVSATDTGVSPFDTPSNKETNKERENKVAGATGSLLDDSFPREKTIAETRKPTESLSLADRKLRTQKSLEKSIANREEIYHILWTMTGREIGKNKTVSSQINELIEWGILDEEKREKFNTYIQDRLNAKSWQTDSWRPTFQQVWENWRMAMTQKTDTRPEDDGRKVYR